jgi:RNA polymerase sigma-70 factor (ECF subfamily)
VIASDLDVVRSVRRGDREAFGQLVREHQRRLFGLVLMMVREPAGAEEVTQDAFVRAYTHLGHYDERRPFYPWIAAIAVRLAQNWLRQHGRSVHREGTALESVDEPGATTPASLSALIDDEGKRTLWRAVATLPSGERTAVILYYRDEMAVSGIARALGVTTGTIKTFLFRARRHLRERLKTDSETSSTERTTR